MTGTETNKAGPGTFKPEEVIRGFLPRHREIMLDLVLRWAELDSGLRMLLSKVLDLQPADGAFLIDRMPASAVFTELRKALRHRKAAAEVVRIVKKHKADYLRHSRCRNLIAHSKCVGHWSVDTDYLVFATFMRTGDGELAVDLVPVQEMLASQRWALAMITMAMRIVDLGSEPPDVPASDSRK